MTSPSNLAVVICHGSYHTPALYQPLIDALEEKRIPTHCPQLPTADLTKLNVGPDISKPDFDIGPPAEGYPQGEQDLEAVLAVVQPLVDEGKEVLLMAHSSGGWVASEAARPELQASSRKAKGLSGGIIGIFYVGAFLIPEGQSISSFFQPKDGSFVTPPFLQFHKHGGSGLGTIVEPEKFLFNDLDPEAAAKWAPLLTASPILTTRLTNSPYAAVPCAYLVLEKDFTLPKEYQEGMIAGLTQGVDGAKFEMYRAPSGHSPQLSWTEGLQDALVEFASKAKAQLV